MNNTFTNLIANLDKTATIAAYRAIAHGAMARALGPIKTSLRAQETVLRDEFDPENSLDQRNSLDGATLKVENPLLRASKLADMYWLARTEIEELSQSKWDQPMNVEQFLQLLCSGTKNNEATIDALASILKVDRTIIEKMSAEAARKQREELQLLAPEIVTIFNGFGDDVVPEAWEALDIVDQHQLAVKAVEGLTKAKEKAVVNILRFNSLKQLGDIPLLEEGETKIREFVIEFEQRNSTRLQEAMDSGVNLRLLQ